MRSPQLPLRRRYAFTLVELLVVVLIIAILTSMVSAAAIKVSGVGTKVRTISEIRQLGVAVENFKTRFGFYPPSRLILCQNFADYFVGGSPSLGPKSPLHRDSLAALSRMFPRIDLQSRVPPGSGPPAWRGIHWSVTGGQDATGSPRRDLTMITG